MRSPLDEFQTHWKYIEKQNNNATLNDFWDQTNKSNNSEYSYLQCRYIGRQTTKQVQITYFLHGLLFLSHFLSLAIFFSIFFHVCCTHKGLVCVYTMIIIWNKFAGKNMHKNFLIQNQRKENLWNGKKQQIWNVPSHLRWMSANNLHFVFNDGKKSVWKKLYAEVSRMRKADILIQFVFWVSLLHVKASWCVCSSFFLTSRWHNVNVKLYVVHVKWAHVIYANVKKLDTYLSHFIHEKKRINNNPHPTDMMYLKLVVNNELNDITAMYTLYCEWCDKILFFCES